jgi:hypothetical protein
MGSRRLPAFAPERPTQTKAASAAAKFTAGKESRLSIRIELSTRKSIRRTAVLADKTVKRFVMEALAAAGVDVAAEDLQDRDDEE